jgi:hypothetical protein
VAEESNIDPFGGEVFGIPRQKTTCLVFVYSHINTNDLDGKVDCSLDVISCQTSKAIKGGGSAAFTLVPRREYLNYIFPDDYVDIFFNPGDGRGYIRTFFGFVDRIERTITVGGNGEITTRYNVSCTDFTKAFDRTQIYFNPHIGDRSDFLSAFSSNIAGTTLRTKGVEIAGSPADIIMNLVHVILGFGSQFALPESYPSNKAAILSSRDARLRWLKTRLDPNIKAAIDAGGLNALISKISSKIAGIKSFIKNKNEKKAMEALGKLYKPKLTKAQTAKMLIEVKRAIATNDLTSSSILESLVTGALIPGTDPVKFKAYTTMVAAANASAPRTLLDLIDFSFLEYDSIDGSICSASIWTQEGTLWALMNSLSNDIVNELFCDLRPLSSNYNEPMQKWNSDYAVDLDDTFVKTTEPEAVWGGLLATNPADTLAVRFAPAIIMREYPFSTIETIDTKEVSVFEQSLGCIYLGAMFSKQPPGKAGRAILIKSDGPVSDWSQAAGSAKDCARHLDVAAISIQDIISESIGRGDAEVTNLIELYSDMLGDSQKFVFHEVQPIVTPVSVMKHGLRVWSNSTRFADFSVKTSANKGYDTLGTRQKVIRWVIMLDHWKQHNEEYLNGSITTRGFPEIRVGYRLDILERHESYYVEGVTHNWQYPEPLTTTLTVSRGQRNDPYPVYIKPESNILKGSRQTLDSRLNTPFLVIPNDSVLRNLTMNVGGVPLEEQNYIDQPRWWEWGIETKGYTSVNGDEQALYSMDNIQEFLTSLLAKVANDDPPSGETKGSILKGVNR